ncbi:MAG: heme o synthase [Gemmatimonadaceae bacterium]
MTQSAVFSGALTVRLELLKLRIVLMVMLTVGVGFALAGPPEVLSPALLNALVGTALVAAGAGALNQFLERDVDALMRRTAHRPLPSGRLRAAEARAIGVAASVGGVVYLAATVNLVTAAVAAFTVASYVLVYTPLKRVTSLSTLVGAVPGALPIVGGWAAGGGALGLEVWVLFWIVFFWQLPHFLALSWIYREDYARAGLETLSVGDTDGRRTFRQAALYAAALVPVSLAPAVLGMAGSFYFVGAALLSGCFAAATAWAGRERTPARARRLFVASLVYLPGILVLMVTNRLP